MLDIILENVERKLDLLPSSFEKTDSRSKTFSTGSLSLDLIMGGGVPWGRFVVYSGIESSGKSTVLYSTLLDLLFNKDYEDTYILFFDHEGTLTLDYLAAISRVPVSRLRSLFHKRVRYYEPELGDQSLQLTYKVLKQLPRVIDSDNGWYLLFPKNLSKKVRKDVMERYEGRIDQDYLKKKDQIRVPIEKPYPTLVVFLDSLAAMFPAVMEENTDSERPGTKAGMFSKWLSAIKPLLSSRFATIVATNQIRERPMTMFGSPFYEPGGNAIKFYSDIRAKINACSIPHGKGQVEEVGDDRYRYSKVETIKNKVFAPHRKTYLRIWISDSKGKSRGIDPVWDVLNYLKETKQIKRSKGKLVIKGLPDFDGIAFTEKEFAECIQEPIKLFLTKKLSIPNKKIAKIVEDYKESEWLSAKQAALINRYSIQKACRRQIETGEAFNLYFTED